MSKWVVNSIPGVLKINQIFNSTTFKVPLFDVFIENSKNCAPNLKSTEYLIKFKFSEQVFSTSWCGIRNERREKILTVDGWVKTNERTYKVLCLVWGKRKVNRRKTTQVIQSRNWKRTSDFKTILFRKKNRCVTKRVKGLICILALRLRKEVKRERNNMNWKRQWENFSGNNNGNNNEFNWYNGCNELYKSNLRFSFSKFKQSKVCVLERQKPRVNSKMPPSLCFRYSSSSFVWLANFIKLANWFSKEKLTFDSKSSHNFVYSSPYRACLRRMIWETCFIISKILSSWFALVS